MSRIIHLELTHPELPPGDVEGYRFLWARYVRGFDARRHCQPCLVGPTASGFGVGTAHRVGRFDFELDRRYPYDFLYVCGLASGPKEERGAKNLHFPLRHEPGATARIATFNGYELVAHDAVEVTIPERQAKGWSGLDEETLGCKNFRFAMGQYGYPGGVTA